MSQEINKYVAQAIVELAVFLEFSEETAVNQDAAIQALEQLASTLQMADSKAKSSLCSQFENIAVGYSGEQADFVEGLGEALGLIEE
ncbi:hypothetical protein [Phytopseudomonas dryadis]|uniref:Uncharacterized protein n=1 Tax=Phytopseudomonas dryadis TaxID=2487520 RepID=A0ABY1ZBX6_9GAMM|nr:MULTISPECIES: hypothetical protein [Pseudomonas]TBV08478.1 hypothetical protein DNK34_04225 [Pseudomonas dryadis]TBV18847.1 hypothetical protein DNK41_05650 [Pseudomonas sp. FRB 230]